MKPGDLRFTHDDVVVGFRKRPHSRYEALCNVSGPIILLEYIKDEELEEGLMNIVEMWRVQTSEGLACVSTWMLFSHTSPCP